MKQLMVSEPLEKTMAANGPVGSFVATEVRVREIEKSRVDRVK